MQGFGDITELDGLTRSVRRNAIESFKRSDGVLTRQFRKVATSAYSVQGVIARAEDSDSRVRVDRAWGNAPNAATWEPVPGLKRADFQAKIAALKAADGDAKDKEQTALKVPDDADKLAADLHAVPVRPGVALLDVTMSWQFNCAYRARNRRVKLAFHTPSRSATPGRTRSWTNKNNASTPP